MFKHDILLVDLECTGLDPLKHDPIQLAGILLDKKTLKEKQVFSSFIKPAHWNNWDPEAMAVNKIDKTVLKTAPTLATVINRFEKLYSHHPVILSFYGGMVDVPFLKVVYKKLGKKYPFDYHPFDLWAICHTYLATKNLLKNKNRFNGFTLEDLLVHFKLPIENRHDALADCKAEASVFRKIYKELKR